ncbi:MAG: polymerase, sigma 32 subunit, RpoH [Fibrobacteres bacterium]|nr:polymerase, sigma 32 subunit, RpoH [Fibrobacterota bacterium]
MVKEATKGPIPDSILKCYLEDIRRSGQVPRHEEHAMFLLARQGNARARERLIAANMRFVVKVALEYRSCPVPMADLISEGAIGLIHSVETFEPSRGVKFISYAVWWIRSSITKALNEKGYLIRLPANQYFRLRKAQKAEGMEGPEEPDLRMLRQLSQGCASLDAVQPGTGMTWSEQLRDPLAAEPDREAERNLGTGLTEAYLSALPEREGAILRGFYGLGNENPITLREVGSVLGLSSERVRQIRKKAIARIRNDPAAEPLRERYQCLTGNPAGLRA